MANIRVLPFAVANLIAAGEVVDRPASVIKELMENSIDAGATRITVEIQNGGVTLMRVTDDGCGIAPEDLPVAIQRHATSKIRTAEDLDGILTLGFRGEALAAISSVADVRILSRTEENEFGTLLVSHYGEVVEMCEQGCSKGTSVFVENLFSNVPARRKFLKKDITESIAVTANVEKVALSHPNIAMRLIIDGAIKLETAGDGNLHNTIYSVFGKEFASRLIEIDAENEGIGVKGFIGRSDNFKGNRNYQSFFINGRFVKSKTATAALEQGFTSYMPPEKFPACVLFLTINPTRVDVNVHPAKLEVKFSNEKLVFESIYYAVRTALEQNATRPSVELSLSSRPKKDTGFFPKRSEQATPVQDRKESLQSRQLSYDLTGATQPQPQIRMSAQEYRQTFVENNTASKTPTVQNRREPVQVQNNGFVPKVTVASDVPTAKPSPQLKQDLAPTQKQDPPAPIKEAPIAEIPKQEAPAPTPTFQHEEPRVTAQADPEPVRPAVRSYRIVGEVFASYVLVECEDKLLLVDKHAAHERILFEGLKAGLRQLDPCSQLLMLPIDVMMTSGEVEALKTYDGELRKIGFSMTYARNTVSVNAIPQEIEVGAVSDMLQAMAARILNATGSVTLTRDIIFEKALYQAACKAAIKAGRTYAQEHIEWLIGRLMELPDITFCPHGRPVALELSHHTLDKQFDRTGF
ncbi:MAG: DNA mismatch repair endonuclease MutL [Clostridia bacterium]|nr:DNA mismatch repair endonuclease MutL [Clostridia bacterium]